MSSSATPPPLRLAGRVFAIVLGALLVLAVAMLVWVGIRGYMAYTHLQSAQKTAAGAADELSDPSAASTLIDALSTDTSAAHALTSDPIWSIVETLPWIGPQLDAVSTVAAAADQIASTALAPLGDVAATFSVDSLKPVDGHIDTTVFTSIQDAAATSAAASTEAASAVAGIDRSALLGPVADAVDEVGDTLDTIADTTTAIQKVSVLLPAMLGADGARDYLVVFQNNAEWRSLGGIVGAMAVVHTDGGSMSLTAQDSSSSFSEYASPVLPLSDDILQVFGERPGKWIQNVTQIPDFEESAPLAQEMWSQEHGQTVDGVISVDPVALSYVLEATGPVTLATGDVLTSDNAVQLMLNEVYLRYSKPAEQDAFFAAATAAVFVKLSSGDVDPATLVTALAKAGEEHRLLIWSDHPEDQAELEDTTLAGGLPASDAQSDAFGVYLNDGTGSKMDYYLDASTTLDWDQCTTLASGEASGAATLSVTVTSNAPADAASLPSYITGGGTYGVPVGTARTLVYVYLPESFTLAGAERSDGGGFGGGTHEGRRVVSFQVDLTPGQSMTATITASTDASAPTLTVSQTPGVTSVDVPVTTCG
ncbi:MAG: DUF4012 domain-containing protein [Microbacterium sp.]